MNRWHPTNEELREVRRITLGWVFAVLFGLAALLYAAQQSEREATLEPVVVSEPVSAFYGQPRDTSAVARVCCRVLGR